MKSGFDRPLMLPAMSNILLLGVGPLPIDRAERLHAPGIRVWHLAQILAQARHRVVIGLIEFGDFRDSASGEQTEAAALISVADGISVFRIRYHSVDAPRRLAALHVTSRFHAVVSTSDIMNSVAADLPVSLPLWLDLLGDPFTERQVQSAAYHNDVAQLEQWRLMSKALLRGDRFSAASTPQKHVLIGQLGFAGRLNQFNSGTELVHVLPNARPLDTNIEPKPLLTLRGRRIPQNAFVLLWAGGYNTWADPDTLFAGVEAAMREAPDLYFVSAGGAIPGHDNVTFRRFKEKVDASPLANRFQFLGWVPSQDVPSLYLQADAALNVDLDCYEAEIGTRTRIIDWIQFRVPVITTALCEPARKLRERGLISAFEPGDPGSLKEAILRVHRDRPAARERAEQALAFFHEEFDESRVFAPLLEWAAHPVFAPDRIAAGATPLPGVVTAPFPVSPLARRHEELINSLAVARREPEPNEYTPFLVRAARKLMRRIGRN